MPPLHERSSVLALITHYRCEAWLAQAIESLLAQTHPLNGIVVIDDASAEPPVEIVRRFPQVTLLTSESNVGPYRLIQTVIDRTQYDAYLMQDADDWSRSDRLALLLAEAERTGAELLGTRLINISTANGREVREPRYQPSDVNSAYVKQPGEWFLSWGTAIVGRALVTRLGGLATGLRVSADVEFANRAHHLARVVNVREHCYYRRKRPEALTSAAATGKGSPLRMQIRAEIKARAYENAVAVAAGQPPDLAPLRIAQPIDLHHVLGPALHGWPLPVSAASLPIGSQ